MPGAGPGGDVLLVPEDRCCVTEHVQQIEVDLKSANQVHFYSKMEEFHVDF